MSKELRRYGTAVERLLSAMLIYGWSCRLNREPQPGDLVMLSCAPPGIWHLSFYREKLDNDYHLLESLKTGEICRWGNVGFYVIDEEKSGLGRQIRWTDEQFDFAEKFAKARKRADFYINVPYIERFDGELVYVRFRTRYNFDEINTEVAPIRWPKITIKALLAELLAGESVHVAARDSAKKEPPHG